MAVQNSPLFNSLPPEILLYTLHKVYLLDVHSFATTCKDAHQIISKSWAEFCSREGFLEKEVQYCFFTSKCIQRNFPRLFDTATSQLPYLLSSKGLTFRNKDGILTNAKCVFNSGSSALAFRCYSENGICSVERLISCTSSSISGQFVAMFDQSSPIDSDSYARSLVCLSTTRSSQRDAIIGKQNFEEQNILFKKTALSNFELSKAEPLQIELPPMDSNIQKFDAKHFDVRKLREVKPIISWKRFALQTLFFTTTVSGVVVYAMNYFQPNSLQNPSVCNMLAIDMLHLQCYI